VLRQFLPYRVEQVYNRFGGYMLLVVLLLFGGFIFRVFYDPLLNVFDGVLVTL
jgi:hypothetical protein